MLELVDSKGNRFRLSVGLGLEAAPRNSAPPLKSRPSRIFIRHLLRDCKPLDLTRAHHLFFSFSTANRHAFAQSWQHLTTEEKLYSAIADGQIRLQQTLKVKQFSATDARNGLSLAKNRLRSLLEKLSPPHPRSVQQDSKWGLTSLNNTAAGHQIKNSYQLFLASLATSVTDNNTAHALNARQHALVLALGFIPAKISTERYKHCLQYCKNIWRDKELPKLLDDFVLRYSGDSASPATRFEIAQTLLLCAGQKPDILNSPSKTQLQQFETFKHAGSQLAEAAEISARLAKVKTKPGSQMDLGPQSAGDAEIRENTAPPETPTYIEITLLDDQGNPVADEPYWIRDPEGNEYTGNTDANGMARVDQIKPGMCQVKFPDRDSGGVGGAVEASTNPPPTEKPKNQAAAQEKPSADQSAMPQTSEADVAPMIEEPVIEEPEESESILEGSKESSTNYWETQKETADNFPEYLAAHLMGLNAETGYSIAEGLEATYHTLTDWDKFKGAVAQFKDGVVDIVSDPKGTYDKLVKTATDFYNLPDAEKGDAAYKAMMGALAGGGAGKGAGALGEAAKKLSSSSLKTKIRDIINQLTDEEKEKILSVSTFEAKGVKRSEAVKYLNTTTGQEMLISLKEADPLSDSKVILERAVGLLQTGTKPATLVEIEEPLLKLVPKGSKVSPCSPFFTTEAEIKKATESGRSIADYFGLPASNHVPTYDIYKIEPKELSAKAFQSQIAPTSELGGKITTEGGGIQILVTNRELYSTPSKVGQLTEEAP